MDIKFEKDWVNFNVRTSCIIKDKLHKKVILTNMKAITDHEAFLLPGGRLNLMENRYNEINHLLATPEVLSDVKTSRELSIELSNLEENNHFSGEYYQEPQLVKNIEKQSSEFQSKSQRNLNINKFNTPGPGSYEKNIQDQDLFGGFNQYRKPKNIIETIKMSVIPTDIQKFIQKYQSIAFNSRIVEFVTIGMLDSYISVDFIFDKLDSI